MLTEPTIDKLHALRLAPWPPRGKRNGRTRRGGGRLRRALRDARRRRDVARKQAARAGAARGEAADHEACIEDIDYAPQRELDRALLRQLGTGAGSGHTRTCSSPARPAPARRTWPARSRSKRAEAGSRPLPSRAAAARGARARPRRRHLHAAARALRQDRRPRARRLGPRAAPGAGAARHARNPRGPHGDRSTIVTSQLPVENWHDYVADPTIADALLDRLVHNAHRLKLKGPSRRNGGLNPKLNTPPTSYVASLRRDHDDRSADHDGAISAITIAGIRIGGATAFAARSNWLEFGLFMTAFIVHHAMTTERILWLIRQ